MMSIKLCSNLKSTLRTEGEISVVLSLHISVARVATLSAIYSSSVCVGNKVSHTCTTKKEANK